MNNHAEMLYQNLGPPAWNLAQVWVTYWFSYAIAQFICAGEVSVVIVIEK